MKTVKQYRLAFGDYLLALPYPVWCLSIHTCMFKFLILQGRNCWLQSNDSWNNMLGWEHKEFTLASFAYDVGHSGDHLDFSMLSNILGYWMARALN